MKTELTSNCIQTTEATVVEVVLTVHPDSPNPLTFRATGYAKKHPKDRYDAEIGMKLAYGRALEELGRRLKVQASLMIQFPILNWEPTSSTFSQYVAQTARSA